MNDSMPHNELPLPEYDHIPIGHLPARIAPLDSSQMQQLVTYEREHGNRLPVLVVLEHRLEALNNGVEPSGEVTTNFPEVSPSASEPTISPETTTAPQINPPSHGNPTNPAR
ncbi:MAG TPA: hypothetical protein VGP24_01985 [Glaciihabitans sp.]|jgi:hypothetical protein|nr:hypothetical protein [Glaciihabitans sp.]